MTDNVKMLFDKKNIPKVNVFVKCVFIYGTIDSCDEFMTPFMVKFLGNLHDNVNCINL